LSKGYEVLGRVPNSVPVSYKNIKVILDKIEIVQGDLYNQEALMNLLQTYQPDEIYNLASPSSPSASWKDVVNVSEVTALGVARLLEAVRLKCPDARFYQASSSELFGNPVEAPQNENTPFHPRNPYGIAKLYAHLITVNYREKHNLFAVSGIMYNHESPRRDFHFVTRKITHGAAQIKLGESDELKLGNLKARRDWGFAGDYVEAMWLMLQQDSPNDFVVGSGETHSVKEFCEIAFKFLGLDYKNHVRTVPEYYRPIEEKKLVADIHKIKSELGWEPKCKFVNLIQLMVEKDMALILDSSQK
jgi:GDPmannose 4,6-dehydratase